VYDDHWGEADHHRRNALKLYGRAITFMKKEASSGRQDQRLMLLTCFTSFCFEAWTGNQELAFNQILTGVNLIRTWNNNTTGSLSRPEFRPSFVEEELPRLFAGLALQLLTFTSAMVFQPVSDYQRKIFWKTLLDSLSEMPEKFVSLKEAGVYQSIIQRFGMHVMVHMLAKSKPQPTKNMVVLPFGILSRDELKTGYNEMYLAIEHIERWWKSFDALSKALHEKGGKIMVSAIILNLHITTLYVGLKSVLDADETSSDKYHKLFKEIVKMAEVVVKDEAERSTGFSFGVGVIFSLQFTAQNCRVSNTRRKAIALLLQTARREGIWDSLLFGQIMQWVADIEEEFMENGQIPGWARIPGIKRVADLQRRTATLTCQQRDIRRFG
jgi:hypothetical protein